MEKISKMVKNEKDISYEVLKQIEQHAKEYESCPDKKEFLKNVGAYEQKLILLNSRDPYEVLCYMESLDLPTTKLVLSELNYNEISKILFLFTSEDKKLFYTTFSDLDLVNHFITYDKKATEYISDLSIDRKINLLNSSDLETALASSKVLDTISDEEKLEVIDSVKTADGISALSSSYNNIEWEEINTNSQESTNLEQVQEVAKEQEQEELQENEEQQQEEQQKQEKNQQKEIIQDLELEEKMNYFRNNFDKYKETNPELNDIDINTPELYTLLSAALLEIIKNDYQVFKEKNAAVKNTQESNEQNVASPLEQFQQKQKQSEIELIQVLNTRVQVNNLEQTVVKTNNL